MLWLAVHRFGVLASAQKHRHLKKLFQLMAVAIACLQLSGGALGFLQLVAWGGMLVTYSQQDGLVTGVRKTFDGEHPCCLCRKIEQVRRHEQQQPQNRLALTEDLVKRLSDSFIFAETRVPEPHRLEVARIRWHERATPAARRSVRPPTPPPRFA